MKPSEVAKVLADRMRRDTLLAVFESPDLIKGGTDINIVIRDPDITMEEEGLTTLKGRTFGRLLTMNWELNLVYTESNWSKAADTIYDVIVRLTDNLQEPLVTETNKLDAIIEGIEPAEPSEEGKVGFTKLIRLRTLSGG